jgi:hypothetical protein
MPGSRAETSRSAATGSFLAAVDPWRADCSSERASRASRVPPQAIYLILTLRTYRTRLLGAQQLFLLPAGGIKTSFLSLHRPPSSPCRGCRQCRQCRGYLRHCVEGLRSCASWDGAWRCWSRRVSRPNPPPPPPKTSTSALQRSRPSGAPRLPRPRTPRL